MNLLDYIGLADLTIIFRINIASIKGANLNEVVISKNMVNFLDATTKEGKELLAKIYKQLAKKEKRIQIESLEELEKIMKDKPNTTRRR